MQLFNNLADDFDCFYVLFDCISQLDLIIAFSKYVLIQETCVKPSFDNREVKILNSFHPILHKFHNMRESRNKYTSQIRSYEKFINASVRSIENDIDLSVNRPFLMITGANMSGKSTYLKQMGLLQVMAQCGCYVPASGSAKFVMIKQIFSRLGSDCDLSLNASSFESEMLEINYMLNKMDKANSLTLIDELCRSTNIYEGLALCFAICEHVLKKFHVNSNHKGNKMFVLFTTHLKELAYLECLYDKANNYSLDSYVSDDFKSRLKHTYKLKKGVCELENYGLKLAYLSSMPASIIEDAVNISSKFSSNLEEFFKTNASEAKKRVIFKYLNKLMDLKLIMDELDDEKFLDQILTIQVKFEQAFSE